MNFWCRNKFFVHFDTNQEANTQNYCRILSFNLTVCDKCIYIFVLFLTSIISHKTPKDLLSIICVGRNALIPENNEEWSVSDSKVLRCRKSLIVWIQLTCPVWWSLRWRWWRWKLRWWQQMQLSSLPGKNGAQAHAFQAPNKGPFDAQYKRLSLLF